MVYFFLSDVVRLQLAARLLGLFVHVPIAVCGGGSSEGGDRLEGLCPDQRFFFFLI
jgi:hypothetical protein